MSTIIVGDGGEDKKMTASNVAVSAAADSSNIFR